MAPTSHSAATADLNHLIRGTTYLATVAGGTASGEYLGIEAPHGDHSILLRHHSGTHSIPLAAVMAIEELI